MLRRRSRRLPRTLRGLSAILLSGVFMVVTAGLPATASSGSASRAIAVDSGSDLADAAVLAAVRDLPDVAVKAGSPTDDTDVPPPPSSWVDVVPLDRYLLQHWGAHTQSEFGEPARATTDPDRGPPAPERL